MNDAPKKLIRLQNNYERDYAALKVENAASKTNHPQDIPYGNKYSCSGSLAFKSGSSRLRFSYLFLCYK